MKLYGIHYSPWSLRATWALKHHAHWYDYEEYLPMVSTPKLRVKLGDYSSKVTIPILFRNDEAPLRDSYDIGRYAEDRGSGDLLFAADEEVTRTWTATADVIASSGRALTTAAVLADNDAVRENVPPFVPRGIRRLSSPIVHLGATYLARKYEFEDDNPDDHRRELRRALEMVANRLVAGDYLADTFGWSDVAVVSALQFVRPADGWVRQRPATKRAWTRARLADEFADVLGWRDQILARHWPAE